MNNNASYELVKKEVQKKIINYLFVNHEINVSEYEALISKCDEKIEKINEEIDKDNYIHSIEVDIGI